MKDIIQKFQKNERDTGSSEVQIIAMTQRIQSISAHTKFHKKDFHCKRGLMQCISRRKSLLKYLKSRDGERYLELVQALGLRH